MKGGGGRRAERHGGDAGGGGGRRGRRRWGEEERKKKRNQQKEEDRWRRREAEVEDQVGPTRSLGSGRGARAPASASAQNMFTTIVQRRIHESCSD